MAMNGTTCGTAAAAAMGVTDATAIASIQQLCTAILAHIAANATITVTVSSVTGTATGVMAGAAAVPVTGTGSGTATIA